MTEHTPNKSDPRRPKRLTPPQGAVPDTLPKRFSSLFIVILFVMLIIATGYVLIVLPSLFTASPPSVLKEVNQPQTVLEGAKVKTAESAPDPTEAEQALKLLISKKIQAESANISAWAPIQYRTALDSVVRGDELFRQHDYENSTTAYRDAVHAISRILESKQQIFTSSLQKANTALINGDSSEALLQFKKVQAIDPASTEASLGLQRAETIANVIELHNQALVLEKSEKLNESEAVLKNLRKIDPYYIPGQKSLERVQTKIEKQLFNSEMSLFYHLLDTGKLKQARLSLDALKKISKKTPQVIQAEKMLAVKIESDHINNLQKKGALFCKNEQWEEALTVYKQVIAIAPAALFAVNGMEQATKRMKLDKILTDGISRSHRLQDITQREKTEKLLKYARTITPQTPRLTSQITQLQNLVDMAATPVAVTIDSDNMTDITIYQVGRFGNFHSQKITLTPGTYTVVGTRTGFHDVRITIEVVPVKATNRFHIQCKDPI